VAILGLIAVGAGLRHESPLSIALGIALLAVVAGAYALLALSARGLRVRREMDESAFEGDSLEVRFVLRNGSRLPIFYPRIVEVFPPEVQAEKTALFPYRVRPGEMVVEAYRGDCILPRGVYPIGPATISVSDPLGWFQVRLRVAGETELKVYPRFQSLGAAERFGASLSPVFNDMTLRGIGDSNEFFSVREYRPGDPLRRVHWALSAHRGYPVVREHTRTAVGDLCVFIDLYRFALLGVGRGSSLELGVKISASLASRALGRGHRVQLVASGRESFRVPHGKGPRQFQAILDALVRVKPDGPAPLDDVIETAARDVSAGSTAVVTVSPYLFQSERFLGQVGALRRRGVRVVLVVFDDATFHNLYEVDRTAIHSEDYARRMRTLGFDAILVPCAADLPAVFSGSPRHAGETGGEAS
jgi:uncharacterized protein (DUF58 family)